MTSKQQRIATLYRSGGTIADIAARTGVAQGTVRRTVWVLQQRGDLSKRRRSPRTPAEFATVEPARFVDSLAASLASRRDELTSEITQLDAALGALHA